MKNIYILLKLLKLIFIINKISLVYTKEALAELWDVEDSDLLHYLGIENNLVAVDTALREVLRGFSSSFGGTYLDVKNNTRVIVDRIFDGDGIINYDAGLKCSVGFWARHAEDEENYLVTAGHCYDSSIGGSQKFFHLPWGSEDPGLGLGSMESFEIIEEYDLGLIDITDKNVGQSAIINNIDSESFRELHILEDSTMSTHGAHICKSGMTTHFTCGFVRGLKSITTSNTDILEDLIYYGKDTFQTSCGGIAEVPYFLI
ncbi:streptogrisin B [Gigaspora margarita]|uniref:Streptogrisin B n=1 Tax=Gigaspora margarita TaxID=4874 RepID=A0A8H3X2V2_GIGMA|nr:streptogrisin B [Gigaspora margarita]